MANEITISTGMRLNNGFLQYARRVASLQVDQIGEGLSSGVQIVGSSTHEQITISSDITTNGYAFLRNLDATETVQIGLDVGDTFYPFAELQAGEVGVIRLANVDIYAQATGTSDVSLEWAVAEA
jgi:hypothetical protein